GCSYYLLHSHRHQRDLHSFPTRRSSDLTLGSNRVLGVYAHPSSAIDAGAILHWIGLEAMLLTYAGGWVIVPGALAGLTLGNDHRSEEHTSELQSRGHLVCRLLLEKKKTN